MSQDGSTNDVDFVVVEEIKGVEVLKTIDFDAVVVEEIKSV